MTHSIGVPDGFRLCLDLTWPYHTLKPDTHSNSVPDGFRLCLDLTWPNLTVLHTQTGYTLKPWHRDNDMRRRLDGISHTLIYLQIQPCPLPEETCAYRSCVLLAMTLWCMLGHSPHRHISNVRPRIATLKQVYSPLRTWTVWPTYGSNREQKSYTVHNQQCEKSEGELSHQWELIIMAFMCSVVKAKI